MQQDTDWPSILRGARDEAHLTQAELGERLGHAQSWVTRIEKGRQGIRVDEAQAWMLACGHDLQFGDAAVSIAGIDADGQWLVKQLAGMLRIGLADAHRLTLKLQLSGWPIGKDDPALRLVTNLRALLEGNDSTD